VSNKDREKVWEERVTQWRASALSQRAYAIEQGFPIRQVGYWVRRLTKSPTVQGLLPVLVASAAPAAISLRNERGWTLSVRGTCRPAGWPN
jgi:hypothetical protein